ARGRAGAAGGAVERAHVHAAAAFVDDSVAVVVEGVVAALAGRVPRSAGGGLAVHARGAGDLAGAQAAGDVAEHQRVVDDAVAVVVDAVAGLGGGAEIADAGAEHAVDAVGGAAQAGAHAGHAGVVRVAAHRHGAGAGVGARVELALDVEAGAIARGADSEDGDREQRAHEVLR